MGGEIMFGISTKSHLFSGKNVQSELETHKHIILSQLDKLTSRQLSDMREDDIFLQLAQSMFVEAPKLMQPERGEEKREKKTINDFNRRVSIEINVVPIRIPYDGDDRWFMVTPTNSSIEKPHGNIGNGFLYFDLEFSSDEAGNARKLMEENIKNIKYHLAQVADEINAFNKNIDTVVRQAVSKARSRAQDDVKAVDALGLPRKS